MVRGLMFAMTVGVTSISIAQDETYIHPGTLAASMTITPAWMLNRAENNIYMTGFAEYFLDKNLSFRSDNYIFIDGANEVPFIRDAFRSYFGIAYHFNKKNWDAHVGIQPGVTIMNHNDPLLISEPPFELSPSLALRLGMTYYVWKYFHFFANATYVRSKLSGVSGGPFQTDEIMFSAGLGFQIQTRKNR